MYKNPQLWKEIKLKYLNSDKGGNPGQWSARKAQMSTREYQRLGGTYYGSKSKINPLVIWTAQEWRTKSGRPSLETGERYLPASIIEELSMQEYIDTSKKKRADMREGRQYSKQPAQIARKTAKMRDKIILYQDGNGIFRDITKFFTGKYPGEKVVEDLLKNHGSAGINQITIIRKPIQKFLMKVLDVITFKKLSEAMKSLDYDKLFHLTMKIDLTNGYGFYIEKNEVIKISNSFDMNGAEFKIMPGNPAISLTNFITNGINKIGKRDFYDYTAKKLNCQHFIMNLLDANNLNTPEIKTFVQQDAQAIFEKLPGYTKYIANFLTDIAGATQVLTGKGKPTPITWHQFIKKNYPQIKEVLNEKNPAIATRENIYKILSYKYKLLKQSGRGIADNFARKYLTEEQILTYMGLDSRGQRDYLYNNFARTPQKRDELLDELAPGPQKYDPVKWNQEMEIKYPGWSQLNEANKNAIVMAPFYSKMGDLTGSKFFKALLTGLNDPILADGLKLASDFLIKGGTELAKAVIKGDPKSALPGILKAAAPSFAYMFTASRKDPTPLALAVRAVAEKIAG